MASAIQRVTIGVTIVQNLVAAQLPQWQQESLKAMVPAGWDNDIFRLDADKLVRLPSAERYVFQVEREHIWLPYFAQRLAVAIPKP